MGMILAALIAVILDPVVILLQDSCRFFYEAIVKVVDCKIWIVVAMWLAESLVKDIYLFIYFYSAVRLLRIMELLAWAISLMSQISLPNGVAI